MVQVEVFPNPDPLNNSLRSGYYSVEVYDGSDYIDSHVYSGTKKAWVYPSPAGTGRELWASGSYPVMSYTTFSLNSESVIKIKKINSSINSIDIGPYAKNKNLTTQIITGDQGFTEALVTVNPNDKLWININNEVSSPLFVFADPLFPSYAEVSAQYSTYNQILCPTGIHFVSSLGLNTNAPQGYSNRLQLSSNTLLYIPRGSYIKGNLNTSACNNVKVVGQGVLSLENYDWWNDFVGQPASVTDNGQVFYASNSNTPMSFLDWRLSGNGVSGLTVVNTPYHFNSMGSLQSVDNIKFISPWNYWTDGPKVINYYFPSDPAKLINSFIFCADDAQLPAFCQWSSKCLVSSCYISSHHGSIFANYFTGFNSHVANGRLNHGWSGIDIDSRCYVPHQTEKIGYAFRLFSDGLTSNGQFFTGPTDLLFSSIRFENDLGVPLFKIGNSPYPFQGGSNDLVGMTSGLSFIDISASSSLTGVGNLSSNIVSGFNSTNKAKDITFTNVKINETYVVDGNYDIYFDVVGATDKVADNIRFLFTLPPQQGFGTSKGIVIDYHLDRGQLHPYVATLHHVNEQSKLMQASAYYDDNLAELAQDNWWSNKLVNYANTLTESSVAFPNSMEDYTTYEFGKQFHKLYYDYTHNFARHRLTPNVMQLDGPTIFAHVYGPIFYNSNLSKNGPFTTQYPQYIASSLLTVPELNSRSILFSTSGSSSGTYVASTVADVLTYTDGGSLIPEFRNSGILSHIEFIHPSGANSSNSFSVVRLDKNNKNGYKYNSLTHENTLIRQKSTNSKSRFSFDLRKYSVDTSLGYDVSTNFLTPEHEFSLDLKSLICNNVGEVLGGDSISVWVHTKPEDGKIWSYMQDGRWVQHSLSDVKSSNLVQSYCHVFNLPSQARDTGASLRCGRFKLSDNPNRENDVIASLTESEFNQLNITFNTFNRDIEVPQEYFDKISTSVHRLNQNYVIEIFSNCISQDKFTLFYDIKLVDMTLNKWSKPLVLSKTCKDYRVDLDKRHLYNIFKYFNEIAGAYSSFGYANRTAAYTSGVYEASGGSRINYVENPEWNSVSKSSAGQFINNLNINN
jgi:hypothetical protein